jgi:hypothetical protein
MLPNFNPYMASSEPGQDLATEALMFIRNRGALDDNDNDDNVDGDDYDNASPSPLNTHTGVHDDAEDNAGVKEYAGNVSFSVVLLIVA